MKKLLLLTIGPLMVLTMLFGASPAHASAYGCTGGNPQYGPQGYCVYISGEGTWVSHVRGDFRGSAMVCDFEITAEFFDNNWNWYETQVSPTQRGCATGGGDSIGIDRSMQPGYMCSTLRYTLGGRPERRYMSVCHKVA